MNFEQLSVLASARSIDLKAIAGNATDTGGVAKRRPPNKDERRQRIPVRETADGTETRVARARTWTHAEFAKALAGLRRMPTLAAFYSIEGDESGYAELHRGLMKVALDLAGEEKWPLRVQSLSGNDRYYIEELTELVLTSDKYKDLFLRAPALYSAVVGVSDEIWCAKLVGRYMRLVGRYEGWLGEARAHVNRRLREEFAKHDPTQPLAAASMA